VACDFIKKSPGLFFVFGTRWMVEVFAGWGFLVMQTQKKTIGELLIPRM